MTYHPVIFFASKERAKTPFEVIFGKHYVATFPQVYKTVEWATKYARKQIIVEGLSDVWQLPGAGKVKDER